MNTDNNNKSQYLYSALYTWRASQSAETYSIFMQGMGLSELLSNDE